MARDASYQTMKIYESIGVIRDSSPPLRPVYEIVPNCPQIDGHPRFPEPLSTTTRGYRSASPPRDVERVRVHRAHTPRQNMDSITPHCTAVSINNAVFTADSGPSRSAGRVLRACCQHSERTTLYLRSRFSKCVLSKICDFQKRRKKETRHTRKLRTLQKIILCQSIECEMLNKIAKQLLKMLNKCILFVSS